VLRAIVSNPIQAALVTCMARTGAGTDGSLRMGSLPLPVHFYSPVPDLDDWGVATCGAVEAICRAWTSAPKLKLPI